MAGVQNLLDLAAGNDPPDDCMLPIIVRGNQSSCAIMQFERGILQRIGNPILTQLRSDRPYDDSFQSAASHDETTNHHVVAGLDKAASTEVTERCRRARRTVELNPIEIRGP